MRARIDADSEFLAKASRAKEFLTPAQRQFLLQLYEEVDQTRDGSIDVDELWAGCARRGWKLDKKKVADVFGLIDADGSGQVEQDEFLMMMSYMVGPKSGGDRARVLSLENAVTRRLHQAQEMARRQAP